MRGLTITPGAADSLRLADDLPEPAEGDGEVLVEAIAVGVCGTDREIIAGEYGEAPDNDILVIGHESLGRVLEDPTGTFAAGDLVAGIVRHPDPEPCPNCAAGEWDMCRNGGYTEHGIKGRHGFARERYRLEPGFAVRLDPALGLAGVLLEPASVLAKAWEHIERIGARSVWRPETVLVTGAGPIGLLAALLGTQRDLDVHVLDHNTDGPKPGLVRALGATYHPEPVSEIGFEPDVIIECTAVPSIVLDVMAAVGPNGMACLTGVSGAGRKHQVDAGALNRELVLENNVVFGSVNANRRHWEAAADALARADRSWLEGLITERVPLASFEDAYGHHENEVKVIVEF
ncbi:glucose 1-dehydrogenase [Catenuloplanes sp. NPDC051500]|uniref:glucose 1-dehydrogenase n=1 Tax=Catenuloplanes sp. NPDC051500 TaxID=3363959 RepID=UPI00378C34B0